VNPSYLVDTSLGLLLLPFMDAALFHAPSSLQKAGGSMGIKGLVGLCLDVLRTTEQLSGLPCCKVCALNAGGNVARERRSFRGWSL